MAFEELLVQERLLKSGDLIQFNGQWGFPYTDKLFRVVSAENTQVVSEIALAAPGVQTVVVLDDEGLNPEFENWAYEVRIGVSGELAKLYTRWPSNDFTRQVQDPNFSINPSDVARKLIGFSDQVSTPASDPRYRWFWVKDQLPSFIAMNDSGALGSATPVFEKISLRWIVNILGLTPETDPQVVEGVQNGSVFVSQAQYWNLTGRRSWSNA